MLGAGFLMITLNSSSQYRVQHGEYSEWRARNVIQYNMRRYIIEGANIYKNLARSSRHLLAIAKELKITIKWILL